MTEDVCVILYWLMLLCIKPPQTHYIMFLIVKPNGLSPPPVDSCFKRNKLEKGEELKLMEGQMGEDGLYGSRCLVSLSAVIHTKTRSTYLFIFIYVLQYNLWLFSRICAGK